MMIASPFHYASPSASIAPGGTLTVLAPNNESLTALKAGNVLNGSTRPHMYLHPPMHNPGGGSHHDSYAMNGHGGGSEESPSKAGAGISARNIQRILEEAQYTMELNIAGMVRNMKDFLYSGNGSILSSTKYNLIDTLRADISRNRLTEMPIEICEFFFLEQLNCRENQLRTLPDAFSHLKCLVHLDVSRNSLASLPAVVCTLPCLQILLVSHNRLAALPEQMGLMRSLMELDMSCNQLTHLPWQITCLLKLRSLDVRKNKLLHLPNDFPKLRLINLDLSENSLSSLPAGLRLMNSLETLRVCDNPLDNPPAQLCMRGQTHIFKCLERSVPTRKHSAPAVFNDDLARVFPHNHDRHATTAAQTKLISDALPIYKTPRNGILTRGQSLPERHHQIPPPPLISCLRKSPSPSRQPRPPPPQPSTIPEKNITEESVDEPTPPASSSTNTLSVDVENITEPEKSENEGSREISPKDDLDSTIISATAGVSSVAVVVLDGVEGKGPVTPDGQSSESGTVSVEASSCDQMTSCSSSSVSTGTMVTNDVEKPTKLPVVKRENGVKKQGPMSQIPRKVSPIQATAGRLHGKPVSPTKNGVHAVVGVSSSVASTKAHHTNGSFSARTTTANTARTNSSHSHSVASQPDSSATVKEHHRDGAERVNSAGSGTGSETNGKPSASGVISNKPPAGRRDNTTTKSRNVNGVGGTSTLPAHRTTAATHVHASVAGSKSERERETPNSKDHNHNFTIRRQQEQVKEESEKLDMLRKFLEGRLKLSLPTDLLGSLQDGVMLCHLVNHIRPRSVVSIHVPPASTASPGQPAKLTPAKCRRNVENFLDACRRLGVSDDALCSGELILSACAASAASSNSSFDHSITTIEPLTCQHEFLEKRAQILGDRDTQEDHCRQEKEQARFSQLISMLETLISLFDHQEQPSEASVSEAQVQLASPPPPSPFSQEQWRRMDKICAQVLGVILIAIVFYLA